VDCTAAPALRTAATSRSRGAESPKFTDTYANERCGSTCISGSSSGSDGHLLWRSRAQLSSLDTLKRVKERYSTASWASDWLETANQLGPLLTHTLEQQRSTMLLFE
jgi:hypothetical protein